MQKVRLEMSLYFETYIIIVLLFAIVTLYVAGLYLRSKKLTISLSFLMFFIATALPYFLIVFQLAFGSLNEVRWGVEVRVFEELVKYLTGEQLFEYISGHPIGTIPVYSLALDYFARNLIFIVISITVGIGLGILGYLMFKKVQSAEKP
jgi:uncharacterized membrane protein